MVWIRLVMAAVLLAAVSLALGGEDGADWSGYQKRFRSAFKPLRLAPAAKAAKEIEGKLPRGIVTQPGPFDDLVDELFEPFAARLEEREKLFLEFAKYASPKAGRLFEMAFETYTKEEIELAKRVLAVEAMYAEVYNKGYMESGETVRRTRKTAAVLIPFYRRLIFTNREAAECAVDALAAMKEGENLVWLVSCATGRGKPDLRAAAAEALAIVGGGEACAALVEVLTEDDDAEVRCRALGAMTVFPVQAIAKAVVAALGDPSWQVRSLAGEICARGKILSAVGPLIMALSKEDGRLLEDLDRYLGVLVGVRMQGDAALWKKWWSENRERVEKEAREQEASGALDEPVGKPEYWEPLEGGASPGEAKKDASAFYGIISWSKRVVYVIDISRSMDSEAGATPSITGSGGNPHTAPKGKSKLDVAKWQLHRVLHDLPEDALFGILVYSESYKLWEAELATAGKRKKAAAHRFVDGLKANGTTNICDSLDRAFEIGADTIFLLSDGNPNRGRITDLPRIIDEVRARNLTARMVIHTIGIGEAAGSSFLEELADVTGGQYVGFK